jgi:CRISPR-associated protein Cmr4
MSATLYRLNFITNLHVGSGEVNFNVIDNEVERDPVTNLPTIHSSGVKGALREYFRQTGANKQEIDSLFGSDLKRPEGGTEQEKKEKIGQEKKQSKPGSLRFLTANLLAMPMRASNGNSPYAMVTTHTALDQYLQLCRALGMTAGFEEKDLSSLDDKANYKITECPLGVEGKTIPDPPFKGKLYDFLLRELGEYAVILSEDTMSGTSLPVLARNYLENGKSKNIWYEEIVPHESVFYFAVLSEHAEDLKILAERIGNNNLIQFGGNASIGYGLAQVSVWEGEAGHE